MQKNYELLYIVHPDLEGSTEKVTEKVAGFIKKAEGEITSQEDWGKRKLAYPVAKNDFGVYVLVNFSVDTLRLHEIERDLRLSEEILRSMVVVFPDIKEIVLKPRKEKVEAKVEKVEETANIIVADEKPVKKVVKKAAPKAEKEEKTNIVEKKAPVSAKGGQASGLKKAAPKKAAKTAEADEAVRLKKLDEKLDELLK